MGGATVTGSAASIAWSLPHTLPVTDRRTATMTVTCRGETPIVFDVMNEERVLDIIRKESAVRIPRTPKGLAGAALRRWEREYCYVPIATSGIPRRDGQPGIPRQYFAHCLTEAGVWVPYRGRMMLTDAERPRSKRQGGSRVPALIAIAEDFLPFSNDAWVLDIRRGMRDGHPVWIGRAKFPEWEFTATLRYDPNELTESTIRQLVEIAGYRIGLGCFRMDPREPYHGKRAVFGRFRVT